MRNAKFWINKTSNQNIEGFTIVAISDYYQKLKNYNSFIELSLAAFFKGGVLHLL